MNRKHIMLALLCVCCLAGCGKPDEATQIVIDEIDAITESEYYDIAAIEQAYERYNTLTDKQKEKVTNYADLLKAQDELKEAIENIEIKADYWDMIERHVLGYIDERCSSPQDIKIESVEVYKYTGSSFHDECTEALILMDNAWCDGDVRYVLLTLELDGSEDFQNHYTTQTLETINKYSSISEVDATDSFIGDGWPTIKALVTGKDSNLVSSFDAAELEEFIHQSY